MTADETLSILRMKAGHTAHHHSNNSYGPMLRALSRQHAGNRHAPSSNGRRAIWSVQRYGFISHISTYYPFLTPHFQHFLRIMHILPQPSDMAVTTQSLRTAVHFRTKQSCLHFCMNSCGEYHSAQHAMRQTVNRVIRKARSTNGTGCINPLIIFLTLMLRKLQYSQRQHNCIILVYIFFLGNTLKR